MQDSPENEVPHIKLKDVSFSYPGEKENLIFKCNFSIKKPGFWMIVGKNGSGKSTLLKLINGIIKLLIMIINIFTQEVISIKLFWENYIKDL